MKGYELCLIFLFQHLLKVQDEYKKREAELEKVREDKLKIEALLETLKEQVCDFPVLILSSKCSPWISWPMAGAGKNRV